MHRLCLLWKAHVPWMAGFVCHTKSAMLTLSSKSGHLWGCSRHARHPCPLPLLGHQYSWCSASAAYVPWQSVQAPDALPQAWLCVPQHICQQRMPAGAPWNICTMKLQLQFWTCDTQRNTNHQQLSLSCAAGLTTLLILVSGSETYVHVCCVRVRAIMTLPRIGQWLSLRHRCYCHTSVLCKAFAATWQVPYQCLQFALLIKAVCEQALAVRHTEALLCSLV